MGVLLGNISTSQSSGYTHHKPAKQSHYTVTMATVAKQLLGIIIGFCFLGIIGISIWFEVSHSHPHTTRSQHAFPPIRSLSELNELMKVDRDSGTCSCGAQKQSIGPLDPATRERQKKEYREWKQRESKMAEPMTLCGALVPIQYLGSGITVEPLKLVRLVGLELHPVFIPDKEITIKFTSRNSLGHIFVERYPHPIHVKGNNTYEILMHALNVNDMNTALTHLIYKSTNYHIRQRDYIDVNLLDFDFFINVLIQRPHLPRLYDPGPDNLISKKVTVITKTFERYECINALIASVNKFYPNMTIIVADDSREIQELRGKNVKHYQMPFLDGYTAGKNLVVSQVRTKYALWVDDDYIFTNETILERFVEKLECPTAELDLVSGLRHDRNGVFRSISDAWGEFDYVEEEDGGCLVKGSTSYGRVKEFPNCKLKDVVLNFFLAKTELLRKVGFDLVFERISHRDFFVDALGHMRIAECDDVKVLHTEAGKTKEYEKYRLMKNQVGEGARYAERILFKNNLKCFQSWNHCFEEFKSQN